MKALISPNELIYISENRYGQRIAEVVDDENIFDVAPPLFWIDCPQNCNERNFAYLDGKFFHIDRE
jgi:hypothetical protein